MEAKAVARYTHQSPRKIRKTLDSMRGLKVGDALNQLHFSPEKAASVIEKTLRSAVANLMSQNEESNFDPEDLERAKSLSREQICQFIEDFRDLYGPIFQKRIEGLEIGD